MATGTSREVRPATTAGRLLMIEARALPPILRRAPPAAFDRPTVCTGWSVRDVLAHCSAALHHVARGTMHGFSPEENQTDVDVRRPWPIERLIDELVAGYKAAAPVVDGAGGRLDGVALGEWVHGGDVRQPLGETDAYVSAGSELALELLIARSRRLPLVAVHLPEQTFTIGSIDPSGGPARLDTDLESLVRLLSGRRPDPERYVLEGVGAEELVLFR
ncbi:MAG TPA: maleylpyruvate isomerase family mycothiol-dependent enzyme [Acidimicrobiia bacterium]|jgi:uncharacterized protein (TIGR03083 family)|nr:maleylpyruvate isomerase family mycothiol-dependent enzyme [Acidimicrobiia bacterium]